VAPQRALKIQGSFFIAAKIERGCYRFSNADLHRLFEVIKNYAPTPHSFYIFNRKGNKEHAKGTK